MATAGTSGPSRKKKDPGLMDQVCKFFGGEKKKRSKGSFRGHSASSPQQASARRRANENAVMQFFRRIVSPSTASPRPKSRWRDALGLSDSVLLDDFETARLFMNRSRPHHHELRVRNRPSDVGKTKAHCPESSACDALVRDQEKPRPVHPLNVGAPSSKPPDKGQTMELDQGETGGPHSEDPPPQETLTH